MSEISDALGGTDRSNEGANSALQPFDCALGSLAQQCFQRMKHQLYWVELWRIRRQVAQTCAGGPDRLLYAHHFVEGDVVDHHDISAPEPRDQTLFEVGQEGLAIHGSLDHHRRHDAGL